MPRTPIELLMQYKKKMTNLLQCMNFIHNKEAMYEIKILNLVDQVVIFLTPYNGKALSDLPRQKIIDDKDITSFEAILQSIKQQEIDKPQIIGMLLKLKGKFINNISLCRLAFAIITCTSCCGKIMFDVPNFNNDNGFPALYDYLISLDQLAIFIKAYGVLRAQIAIESMFPALEDTYTMDCNHVFNLNIADMIQLMMQIATSEQEISNTTLNNILYGFASSDTSLLGNYTGMSSSNVEDTKEDEKRSDLNIPIEQKSDEFPEKDDSMVPKTIYMDTTQLPGLKAAALFGNKNALYKLAQLCALLISKPIKLVESEDDESSDDKNIMKFVELAKINQLEEVFWRRRAAIYGHSQAQFELAERSFCCQSYSKYDDAGLSMYDVPDDTLFWLQRATRQHHPNASYLLGMFKLLQYVYSLDQLHKPENGIPLLNVAASNSPLALYVLARCYIRGFHVKSNRPYGMLLLQMSAKLGCNDAKYALGNCLENGIGIEKNPQSAIYCYRSIIDIPDACYRLGKLLRNHESIALYRRAAEQGHVYAEYEVIKDILAHWDSDPSPNSLPADIGYIFRWLTHILEIVILNTVDDPFKFQEPLFSQQILRVWDKLRIYRERFPIVFWMEFLRTFNNTAEIFKPKDDQAIDRLKSIIMFFEMRLQIYGADECCRVPELAWFVDRKMQAMFTCYEKPLLKDQCGGNWIGRKELLKFLADSLGWADPIAACVLSLELFLRKDYQQAENALSCAAELLKSDKGCFTLLSLITTTLANISHDKSVKNLQSSFLNYFIEALHIDRNSIIQIQEIAAAVSEPKTEVSSNTQLDVIDLFSLIQLLLVKRIVAIQQDLSSSTSRSLEGADVPLAVSSKIAGNDFKEENSDSKAEAVQSTIRDASWSTIDSSSLSSSATPSSGSFFSTSSSSSSSDNGGLVLVPSIFNERSPLSQAQPSQLPSSLGIYSMPRGGGFTFPLSSSAGLSSTMLNPHSTADSLPRFSSSNLSWSITGTNSLSSSATPSSGSFFPTSSSSSSSGNGSLVLVPSIFNERPPLSQAQPSQLPSSLGIYSMPQGGGFTSPLSSSTGLSSTMLNPNSTVDSLPRSSSSALSMSTISSSSLSSSMISSSSFFSSSSSDSEKLFPPYQPSLMGKKKPRRKPKRKNMEEKPISAEQLKP